MVDWDVIFKIAMLGVTVLISIVGFLSARTLNKIDSNQTELFNRVHNIEVDFYQLRGEHYATDLGRCREGDRPLYQKNGDHHG